MNDSSPRAVAAAGSASRLTTSNARNPRIDEVNRTMRPSLRETAPTAKLSPSCIAVTTALCLLLPGAARADVYEDFAGFAGSAFGAEREPLVYERFGHALELPRNWWQHVSETSASVGFTTNLPARTYVEYGPTEAYGSTTAVSDRHYSVHLHHLTGLRPGTTYHLRVVLEDERGNVIRGPGRTIAPEPIPRAVRIPGDVAGPPYRLDAAGATYLVTTDIAALHTAFELVTDDVTLDLGGHRVTYDNVSPTLGSEWTDYRDRAAVGVRAVEVRGFRILNGTIAQGAAMDGAHPHESIGFNPVLVDQGVDFEIAGLVLDYAGSQMVGLFARYPGGLNALHHNVFVDRGWEITNRHGTGSRSMAVIGDVNSFHTYHNLVKRTRQSGLDGDLIFGNEIYVDSYATNAFGIGALQNDREAWDNRIFGTGYHVVGMGWGSNNHWHDNLIHLVGKGPDFRYEEYGNQESLNGIRLTQYIGSTVAYHGSVVEDNLVIISGGACSSDGECTQARGLQYFSDPYVVDNVIRRNVFKVVMGEKVTQAAAVVTQGQLDRCGTEAPLRYVENTLISNVVNVRMGDYYGAGCNHVFVDNHLVRAGERQDYRTFAFDRYEPVVGQVFLDTTFAGGASPDLVVFTNPGQAMSVGWTVAVHVERGDAPVRGARIRVEDADRTQVASGVTDDAGRFSEPLVSYTQMQSGRSSHGPHRVVVEHDGQVWERSVTVDGPSELVVDIGEEPGTAAPVQSGPLRLWSQPSAESRGTELRLSAPVSSAATLSIFDALGRPVRSLAAAPGSDAVVWDHRDDAGRPVEPGIYVASVYLQGEHTTCRVVVE